MSVRLQCRWLDGRCPHPAVRLEHQTDIGWSVCSANHGTPLACPACRGRRLSTITSSAFACAECPRRWRLEHGALVGEVEAPEVEEPEVDAPEVDAPVPTFPPPEIAHTEDEAARAIDAMESTAHVAGGYRGGSEIGSVELVRPQRSRRVEEEQTTPLWRSLFRGWAVLILALAVTLAAGTQWGVLTGLGTLLGMLFLGALALSKLPKRFQERLVSIPERRVRVGADGIEWRAGKRWVRVADLEDVTDVVADSNGDRSRVYVRVEGEEPLLLFDELRHEEAEEARSKIAAQVRRAHGSS